MTRPVRRDDDEAFNVRLPSELNRALGFAAVEFRVSKRDIVEQAIREFLSNHDDGGGLMMRTVRDQRVRLGLKVESRDEL